MTQKRRKITNADVTYISLCPQGKNHMQVLYKEDDGTVEFSTLLKDDRLDEEGEITALVYAPGLEDADGHFADKAGIKEMCKSFMRNGVKLDIRHDQKALAKEQAFVSECFLVKAGDPEFAGTKDKLDRDVDTEGAMAVRIQLESEDLRKSYRNGDWDGVSLFGKAKLVDVAKSTEPADDFLKALAERLKAPTSTQDDDEIDMKKEELEAILKERDEKLVASLTTALKPAEKKPVKKSEDDKDDEPLEFKGSKSDPADIKKHLAKVKAHRLQKEVDWDDPESIQAYHDKLAKEDTDKDDDDTSDENDSEADTKVKALQKQIDKINKASNQSGDGSSKLSKEQKETQAGIKRMIAYNNGE